MLIRPIGSGYGSNLPPIPVHSLFHSFYNLWTTRADARRPDLGSEVAVEYQGDADRSRRDGVRRDGVRKRNGSRKASGLQGNCREEDGLEDGGPARNRSRRERPGKSGLGKRAGLGKERVWGGNGLRGTVVGWGGDASEPSRMIRFGR